MGTVGRVLLAVAGTYFGLAFSIEFLNPVFTVERFLMSGAITFVVGAICVGLSDD